MAAPMVKTRTPGVYKRGSRYVVVYYVEGRQRKESARTLEDARALKTKREAAVDSGEFHGRSRATLHEYACEWVERYQGRGRRGFREGTRDDYRRILNQYALKHFLRDCGSPRSRRRGLRDSSPGSATRTHKAGRFRTTPCGTS